MGNTYKSSSDRGCLVYVLKAPSCHAPNKLAWSLQFIFHDAL